MANKTDEKGSADSDVFRYYVLLGIRTILMMSFATVMFILVSSLPMVPESAKYIATHPGAKVIMVFCTMFASILVGMLLRDAFVPSKIVEQFNPNRSAEKSKPLTDAESDQVVSG